MTWKKPKVGKNIVPYFIEIRIVFFNNWIIFSGGGLESEGEFIEIVELSLAEAKDMCDGKSKDIGYAGFLYGLLWFFHYKAPTLNMN